VRRPAGEDDVTGEYPAERLRIGVALPQDIDDGSAHPGSLQRFARRAERLGFDGLWTQESVRGPARALEPLTALAYAAAVTTSTDLGVATVLSLFRHPIQLARATASLDQLSGGRLILGSVWAATGLGLSSRRRVSGSMIARAARCSTRRSRSSRPRGPASRSTIAAKHFLVDDVQSLPRPVQRPGVPVWVAAFPGNVKPLRRAARHDGFFPVGLESVDQFAEAVAAVRDLRVDNSAPYDIAVDLPPGADVAPYAQAGATWWMTGIEPGASLDDVRGVMRDGPAV
jgi:alkanesulfonate monooxygenase SsuD/methylene tetrahydromethanopterin reductase-like flavin-dependent oxidoreductase (luciferase family)